MPVLLIASPEDSGKRLDHFLQEKLPDYSRARLQSWIHDGRVRVMGEAVTRPAHALGGTERVEVEPAELPPLKAEPEDIALDVLYEDDAVIAINKPAGLVVHAGAGHDSGTLVNALLHRFGRLSGVGGALRPGIVHRLDRFTSGVLLVARHDRAHRDLSAQFSARTVEKHYLALVHGAVRHDEGRIDSPIARDPIRRIRMTSRLDYGRAALTEYRVLRRLPGFTLLDVRIGTGRTHQIRVHMSSLGHPVAGDRLYGAPARVAGQEPLDRLFLHAHWIRFQSPATGEQVTVEAALPADLERWMSSLL